MKIMHRLANSDRKFPMNDFPRKELDSIQQPINTRKAVCL